jgi:putative peptide zinc metalloprotease protein
VSSVSLSNSWYRVSALKPKLRAHARLHRHRYRGEVWYLLQDPASGRVHRFSPAARLVIAAMDGTRTVEELWELANKRLGEGAPTQDEIITLLGQLHATDLLQSDVTPDVAELFERGERQDKARRRRSYANPMAVRVPLLDPNAFLDRFAPWIRQIWGRWGAALWLAVVLPALVLIPPHWPELSNDFSDRVLAVENLFVLWLVFPVIKAMHELGHATATKAGGGEVHDMGIIVLVLLPVPYVEASSSTVFKSKHERALVGAAGMIVELFLAALAFYAWLLVEPGLVRAVLFNVMVIASVSTLIFNGNPLLRYDAYYILADLIEIPNLAQRSLRYYSYLAERHVLGLTGIEEPLASESEKKWFLFFGLFSSIYRILVTVTIALFIAGQFFVIGVILATWALIAMAVVPIVKGIRYLAASPRLRRQRRQAAWIVSGAVATLAAFVFAVPMPFRTEAEGVIWLSDQAMVRAGGNGFVDGFLVDPGTRVAAGDALVQSYDPDLDAQIRMGEAKVAELEAEYTAQFATDRARAAMVRDQLESERTALERAHERAEALIVRAGTDGVFMVPLAADMPGRYHKKGELIGYVVEKARPLARVVVAQDAVDLVRLATERVRVRMVHRPDAVTEGKVVRQVPAGEEYLPSLALAVEGGGQIATDPRDQKGPKSLERMFQVDVELLDALGIELFGERVYVRFDHKMEPLAVQWYRGLRRLFLSRFNV